MMYPLMVLAFATLVLIGMLLFLVPIFVGIFAQLGGDLPMLTQIVVRRLEHRARQLVHPLPGSSARHLRLHALQEDARRAGAVWDRHARCRAPVGSARSILKIGMARFSRTLSTLVGAGVDIIRALEITGTTSGNSMIEDAVDIVRESASTRASRSPFR